MTHEPPSSARLRVLHLIDGLGAGGAEAVLVDLCPRLEALGVDVHVLPLQPRARPVAHARLAARGIDVTPLGVRRLLDLPGYRRLRRRVRALAPDVVHTHLELADVLGTLAARTIGIPSLSTLHILDTPSPGSRAWARNHLRGWVLRRHASRIVAVSEACLRHHVIRWGLPPERCTVLHNGVDLDRFTPAVARRRPVRAELGLPPEARVLVCVAVMRRDKGIDHLIAALPIILRRQPDVRLLLVGDGPDRARLEAMAGHCGVAASVRFAGMRDDVERLLAASDLFVLPSLTDALPTVIAEALAVGLPVVATRVGGVPEMLDGTDAGVLVPPGDAEALAEATMGVLGQPGRLEAMAGRARAIAARRFDAADAARRLHEEYVALVARQPIDHAGRS